MDHPGERASHQLTLMCDDIDATSAELKHKNVSVSSIQEQPWGRLVQIQLPGGDKLAHARGILALVGQKHIRHAAPADPPRCYRALSAAAMSAGGSAARCGPAVSRFLQ